jgi:hypothetical protein
MNAQAIPAVNPPLRLLKVNSPSDLPNWEAVARTPIAQKVINKLNS